MNEGPARGPGERGEGRDHLRRQSAVPGKGGMTRIVAATVNTLHGLREGFLTEAAIKQEAAVALVALPLSFFVAPGVWEWVALIASLLFLFAVEFLNTAIERLCNRLHPGKHEAIKVTKDLGSAAVFFAMCMAGLVWGAALFKVLGIL